MRKMSQSHVMPRSMEDFENFFRFSTKCDDILLSIMTHFRQSSSREDGWLDVKIGRQNEWKRQWVVFDDCVLYLSDQPQSDRKMCRAISMDRVISIRTDVSDHVLSLT